MQPVVVPGSTKPRRSRLNDNRVVLPPAPPPPIAVPVSYRNALVRQNINLVRQVAHDYSKRCREPYADLEQQGIIGLVRALDRFDPSRGVALSSFAVPYIRGAILHYLRDQSHPVRVPRAWQEMYQQVRRIQRERNSADSSAEFQSMDAIALSMDIDPETWSQIRRAMTGWVLPLNEEIVEELPDLSSDNPEYDDLREAMRELESECRVCLELVYFQQMTHREAAKHLGLKTKQVAANVRMAITELT